MKKTVLFGAGQVGAMISRLLSGEYKAMCFADNSPEKQGAALAGLPVLSPEDALQTEPTHFCVCVLDKEREAQMKAQIRSLGFDGEIISARDMLSFDPRAATMRLLSEEIEQNSVPGDVAELGVFRGDFAALINAAFPARKLHLFDTFEGFPEKDAQTDRELGFSRAKAGDFSETGQSMVYELMPHQEQIVLHKGYFPDSFFPCSDKTFAFVNIDVDLYVPTAAALPLFWDRLSVGGAIMIHDYNSTQFEGAKKAVREFCQARQIFPVPLCDLHGSALLLKQPNMEEKR